MAELLKGNAAAKALTEKLRQRCDILKEKGVEPCLAIVRIGEKPDDIAYEKGALKRCEKVGISVKQFVLKEDASEEVLDTVRQINEDDTIHGCLFFRPLKDKKLEEEVSLLLSPEKDMDAMTPASISGVFSNKGTGYPPCTAESVLELLDYYQILLTGKKVTVIGRSMVIGRPLAMLLLHRNATVTICHTKTENITEDSKRADILVVAIGNAEQVGASYVREGQTVIDVGINVNSEGQLCGDVKYSEVEPIVQVITPVPGGVGALTTVMLCKHVIEAAEKKGR